MTNNSLAKDYLKMVKDRIPALNLLFRNKSYPSVVREGQEIIELCLKAMLRQVGIEPPKWHDVGPLLVENRKKFPGLVVKHIKKIARISKKLRKERERAFYGDIDFIPSEHYTRKDAENVIKNINFTVKIAKKIISD